MVHTLVVGVDPGATTGICALTYPSFEYGTSGRFVHSPIALECGSESVIELLSDCVGAYPEYRVVIAVEQFVVGNRAARSSTAEAGRLTRELIAKVGMLADDVRVRPAVVVKRWATNRRLEAAGLIAVTRGWPHARDAARHALYEAVHSKVARDPLSVS